ncbi:MAG TPA: MFS transporter [Methylomirabilota bacterium]|nr:MFS transporter [Methylomirabilota bacterium]
MGSSRFFRSSLWRSLRHRNYRLYFTGQLVSVCGTWMQQVALSWLVYRLTGSATLLGVVGFATQVPVLALGALGGVMSDRFAPHRVAVVTQCAALLQATTLAALALGGWIQPSHIVALGVVSGVVNAFDMPARQALVYQLVDAEDLPNAVALNSSMINAARIVGPGLAGFVIARLGEGACFLINALSFLAVIVALVAMKRLKERKISTEKLSLADSFKEGFRYVGATAPIRDLLLLLGVVGVMGMPYMTLMPVFAADVHKGGADALGTMMGAVGAGALVGALSLARRKSIIGLGRVIALSTLAFGVALVAFTLSDLFWLSLLFLCCIGTAWMVVIAASNTVLQTLAEDAMRGRVMSLFTMMLVGLSPLGSLLGGWLTDRFGAPLVVAGGGAGCALAALVFARQLPRLRAAAEPILLARGVLGAANPAESVGVRD